MAIITVEQVLKHAEEFEQMLADFYTNLSDNSHREGVRLLTSYMGRHRKHITESLGKLSSEQVHRICLTPLRYEPHAADCKCFDRIDLSDNPTAFEVLDAAVILDECLVNLYRQVVQQSVEKEVKELFENLIFAEKLDEIELKKIKAMDYF